MTTRKEIKSTMKDIVMFLKEKKGYLSEMLPKEEIREAIRKVCHKKRPLQPKAVSEWFNRFQKEGLLAHIRLNLWGIGFPNENTPLLPRKDVSTQYQ